MNNFLHCNLYDGYTATNCDDFPHHIDKSKFNYLGEFILNTKIIEAIYFDQPSNYIELRLTEDNPIVQIDDKDAGLVFTYVYMVYETDEEASAAFNNLILRLDKCEI